MSRLNSIIKSINRNGVFKTLSILFQILLLRLGNHSSIKLNNSHYYLRKSSSDLPVFRQIFMDGEYDIKINFQPDVIIDLGANIGLSALYFNKRFPQARILALEPDKNNFLQLQKNINASKNIKALNLAIWNESKSLNLVKSETFGEWGIQVSTDDSNGSIGSVKAITIEELMLQENINHIDILKIDIEGAEEKLFENAEWLMYVHLFIIELHDATIPTSSNSFIRSIAKLPSFCIYNNGENVIVENTEFIKINK